MRHQFSCIYKSTLVTVATLTESAFKPIASSKIRPSNSKRWRRERTLLSLSLLHCSPALRLVHDLSHFILFCLFFFLISSNDSRIQNRRIMSLDHSLCGLRRNCCPFKSATEAKAAATHLPGPSRIRHCREYKSSPRNLRPET
jgi:hypothetical protein